MKYGENCKEVIKVLKKTFCILILMELGVFAWLFLGKGQEEAKTEDPAYSMLQVEEVNDVKAEESKQLAVFNLDGLLGIDHLEGNILSIIPEMIKEFQQFAVIQKELVNSDILEELSHYQLSDVEGTIGNIDVVLELLKQLQEDSTNDPQISKLYEWLEKELQENSNSWNRTLNGEDSFKEERVYDIY
ncbi:hypothetical protein ACFSCX_00935 [Bacillus salitolerans]|uniref:Uncharacterized protein n=1 Tax=Bacillus salitolerans TaxID=1437434 RepID=A0ABW4LL26_9BACI